jgi:type IV pilus biogenesis protein PilP
MRSILIIALTAAFAANVSAQSGDGGTPSPEKYKAMAGNPGALIPGSGAASAAPAAAVAGKPVAQVAPQGASQPVMVKPQAPVPAMPAQVDAVDARAVRAGSSLADLAARQEAAALAPQKSKVELPDAPNAAAALAASQKEPVLVGLYGYRGKMRADFLSEGAEISVDKPGQSLPGGWKVVSIGSNSIVLTGPRKNRKEIFLSGATGVQGGSTGAIAGSTLPPPPTR